MRQLVLCGRVGFAGIFKNNSTKNINQVDKKYKKVQPQAHKDQQHRDGIHQIKSASITNHQQNNSRTDNINKHQENSKSHFETVQKHQIVDQEQEYIQSNIHNSSQKLHILLQQRAQMLQSADLLPSYCDSISALLNKQTFQQNERQLNQINRKLNDLSFQLNSSPQQYFSILNYRYKCRLFQSKFSQVDNYKFIQKATVICQMLIHKKQLQLNQVIFVMQALLKLGSLTVILLMNFTKYIKQRLQDGKHKDKITLQHVLTIMNMSLIKRNQITLQNILYDQVLNFTLKNMDTLTRDKPLHMKVDALNLLLVTDIKRFYKIDRKSKQLWTKKLFREIVQRMDHTWLQNMLHPSNGVMSGNNEQRLNWKNVLAIGQAIEYAHENRLQQLIYKQEYSQFTHQLVKTICSFNYDKLNADYISQEKKAALFTLIFSSTCLSEWINCSTTNKTITQFIIYLNATQQRTFLPIIDLINYSTHHSTKQHTPLISTAQQIYQHYCTKINLYGLAIALQLNGATNIKHNKQDKDSKQLIDRLKACIFKHYMQQHSISNHNTQLLDIMKDQTANNLIVALHDIAITLRNYDIVIPALYPLWQTINSKNIFWQKMKQSNLLNQQNRLLLQLLLNAVITNHPLSPELNQLKQYLIKENNLRNSYLNKCYPPIYRFAHPNHNQYNVFTHCHRFKSKFQLLQQLYKDQKYSFYCWDLLIKQLPRLPPSIRQQVYPVVQRIFLNAFDKDNLRKVVLLTVFTNHICANNIISDKHTLTRIIQHCINELIKAQEIIEYHYQCYVQIVINALSCDLLQIDTFNQIMRHTYHKSPQIKQTTTIILLYGSTIHQLPGMNKEKEKSKVESQQQYLKMLVNRNYLCEQTCQSQTDLQRRDHTHMSGMTKPKLSIYISGRMIAIYLRFRIKQLAKIDQLVYKYVRQCYDVTEWLLMARSYHKNIFQQPTNKQQLFIDKLGLLLKDKLIIFQSHQLLSPYQLNQLSLRLQ